MPTLARRIRQVLLVALLPSLALGQATQRVSVGAAGIQGVAESFGCSISADGRFVVFESVASNLVPGDTNGVRDVFVHDRVQSTTELVSLDSAGVQADGDSGYGFPAWTGASISADGRFVAFMSNATNLVAGDTNGATDIFVRDRLLGTTARVSVDSAGAQANGGSHVPSISADGRFVAFDSDASNLVAGDTNGASDLFVRDRQLGTTERVSVDSSGAQASGYSTLASISADGRLVAFTSSASNLVPNDMNGARDVFVHDRQSGSTETASVDSNGSLGYADSFYCAISANGRYVVLGSWSPNLVASDTNAQYDMFVHDRQTGATELVSVDSYGAQANNGSYNASISADGRFVAFESFASNLVPGDSNGAYDAFVRDRQAGTTELVSVDTGGAHGIGWSRCPAISADGRFVAFASLAPNLVAADTNATWDAFTRDRGGPPPSAFCPGDGSTATCPCGNNGSPGNGCENSASTGGALLLAAGSSVLLNDTLTLSSTGELPNALSIFLQGSAAIAPVNFGDGLRCAGGLTKRLYIRSATAGAVSVPQPGDPSVSARSAALGDVIGAGALRYYQTYYRDPVQGFCASPTGNTWNVSSGQCVTWVQ